MYQPKTGQPCGCRPGVQRDNCPKCEGTGQVIDFAAIREASQAGIGVAVARLQDARDNLRRAGAVNACAAVRKALKSAEGALRHAGTAEWRDKRGAKRHRKAKQGRRKLYVLVIWRDVEPSLVGPFRSEAKRLVYARARRAASDGNGLYRVDCAPGTPPPRVDSFSGGELEPEAET